VIGAIALTFRTVGAASLRVPSRQREIAGSDAGTVDPLIVQIDRNGESASAVRPLATQLVVGGTPSGIGAAS
jgi:hypothetical protein